MYTMLVLSRKLNEKIVIGTDIVITIVDAGNGRVRIGIQAPRTTPVNRLEVWEALNGVTASTPAAAVTTAR